MSKAKTISRQRTRQIETIETTFGHRIRRLRERRGMTATELAASADISKPFLSDLEHNKRTPSAATLSSLAAVLFVSMDYLWTGKLFNFDHAGDSDQIIVGAARNVILIKRTDAHGNEQDAFYGAYAHPKDYPDYFVIRLCGFDEETQQFEQQAAWLFNTQDDLYAMFPHHLDKLPKYENGEATVVEVC